MSKFLFSLAATQTLGTWLSLQSRCIYFAKSLAWDGFQKHPLVGWTKAKLPLEASYDEALDPTNNIPEATSTTIVVRALP